jgi:hypothetical protein
MARPQAIIAGFNLGGSDFEMNVRANPIEAPTWSERRDLARSVVEAMGAGQASGGGPSLLRELACDAKWEVRREVAEGLLYVVDSSDFFHLAGLLANDANHFVRRAAERAMDRRRQIAKHAYTAKRSADELRRQVDLLAKNDGPAAAARAWRILDRYGELVVGSMVHDMRSILTYLRAHCQALIDEGSKRRKPFANKERSLARVIHKVLNPFPSALPPPPAPTPSAAPFIVSASSMRRSSEIATPQGRCRVARTIANTPARTASGSVFHAARISAKSAGKSPPNEA